ncbi:MAG: pyruvate kinase, partial [Lachnospiraceae bacterium]|nr:pyruvate kinase [Lachnospiraceae bacterium]
DELFDHALRVAEMRGRVARGELVVITAGVPLGLSGTTNMLKVQITGKTLLTGRGCGKAMASGNVCVLAGPDDRKSFHPGDIIVMRETDNEMMEQLREAGGIITETGDVHSHAATVGMALGVPVIVGARNATRILKAGTFVTMDAEKGLVYSGK